MCSIVVLNQVRKDYPVVLGTNRDEFYARRTSGPERLLEHPVTVGGRDLQAHGTWMGVTREGLFVGVTNQRTFVPPDAAKRSRGELVLRALELGGSGAIRAHVSGLDGRDYNSFNLMFGDAAGLWVGYGRDHERKIEIAAVPPGIHVLPNDVLDTPDFAKVARARSLIEPHAQAPFEELVVQLKATLADRLLPDLDLIPVPPEGAFLDRARLRELAALCVRTPVYGTRSSTIVALSHGKTEHYLYADGPPDQVAFSDVSGLFGQTRA